MNPPPPYSSQDDHHYQQFVNRPGYNSYDQQPIGQAAQYYNSPTSSFPETPSPTMANFMSRDQQQNERGLGGLIVGLGAAAMLNNAMNQQTTANPIGPWTGEDPLAILARYDTILLIDDSASMNEGSRWREAGLAVSGLADAVVRYDTDGIDVYFMNSTEYLRNAQSSTEVARLFERVRPVGLSTPTDVRVEELLSVYLDRLEASKASQLPPLKPLNLIVITDGEADDPDTLAYALIGFAERLDQGRFPLNQLGIQFIQIGKDRAATKALKNLDDELKSAGGARRDIVDTTPYKGTVTAEFLIKALLGGINKRIDRSS